MIYKGTELRPGHKIEYNGDIWVVMDVTHRTPGKGQALIQARLRSLTTGRSTNERFRSNDTIPRAQLTTRKMEYLYKEDDLLTFMDSENYEQVQINAESLGDDESYLIEGLQVMVQFREDSPLGIELPDKVVVKIVDTEPAVKGDTVNNVLKEATTDSGKVIQVPLFVGEGESVRIKTEDGSYVERVKS